MAAKSQFYSCASKHETWKACYYVSLTVVFYCTLPSTRHTDAATWSSIYLTFFHDFRIRLRIPQETAPLYANIAMTTTHSLISIIITRQK